MNKIAILLKELPDADIGSIFRCIKQGRFYQYNGTRYSAGIVESKKEWFLVKVVV